MSKMRYNKHVDVLALSLRDSTNVIVLEGTIRSSKTIEALECFYFKVKSSNDYLHCLCAKDYDSVSDTLLESDGLGLLTKNYPDVEIKKDKIGGYYLTLKGLDGKKKKILLAGYSNSNQWKKILGKTIGVFLIDEVNIADKQFVDEAFARQSSADNPLMIFTLNGDDPKHPIYQDYINHCKPLFKVPASILADMKEPYKNKGWYYTHWTFQDNPIMTQEKIERAMNIYPIGSYYYKIKILGERGSASGLIYELFATNLDRFIVHDMSKYQINEITIGVDFGGHHSAHTFVATAFCNNMRDIIHIESERIDAVGMSADVLADRFEEFVKKVKVKYRYGRIIRCFVDSAEQTLRNTLIFKVKSKGISAVIENASKRPITDRIDFQLKMFNLGMLKFNVEAKSCIEAYRTARWNDKEGHTNERLDNGSTDIDTMDASEYSMESKMNIINQYTEARR